MRYPQKSFMPTVHLKTGEVVEVRLEDLEDYLYENQDKILVRHVLRRGAMRGSLTPVGSLSTSK
jgi:hypothetical protein